MISCSIYSGISSYTFYIIWFIKNKKNEYLILINNPSLDPSLDPSMDYQTDTQLGDDGLPIFNPVLIRGPKHIGPLTRSPSTTITPEQEAFLDERNRRLTDIQKQLVVIRLRLNQVEIFMDMVSGDVKNELQRERKNLLNELNVLRAYEVTIRAGNF